MVYLTVFNVSEEDGNFDRVEGEFLLPNRRITFADYILAREGEQVWVPQHFISLLFGAIVHAKSWVSIFFIF